MNQQRQSKRRPMHPGAFLRTDVMPVLDMTQSNLSVLLGVSRVTVSQLLHEHRALSADMAVRLERLLGIGADAWLQMQAAVEVWDARQQTERFANIERLPARARRHVATLTLPTR